MSLLMEALKKAEREKQKNAAVGEPIAEGDGADLPTQPNVRPNPESRQAESPLPSLGWAEPTPSDNPPVAPMPSNPSLSLEPLPDAATTPAVAPSAPPMQGGEPNINPSTDLARTEKQEFRRETSILKEEPKPVHPGPGPASQPQSRPHNEATTGNKQHLQNEASTAQRQQHAAHVLTATKKSHSRNRTLPAIIGVAASILTAGGIYLYWQQPTLPVANLPKHSPAPPPPVEAGHGAAPPPSQPQASQSSPPPALADTETAADTASQAEMPSSPPSSASLPIEQTKAGNAISIRHDNHKEQVAPALTRGYSSFMAGNDDLAQREYASILRQDSNNRDALLGLAAIAAKRGNHEEATRTYLHLLNLDPRDPAAQAGMLALTAGQTDPVQSESRVKTLLEQQPDAHYLQFALGNLYVSQSRWAEAQQAFFNAYQRAPDNPDYIYNLAISLDHLNQRALALEYYQRALAQSMKRPANFDGHSAQNRIQELQLPATHKP